MKSGKLGDRNQWATPSGCAPQGCADSSGKSCDISALFLWSETIVHQWYLIQVRPMRLTPGILARTFGEISFHCGVSMKSAWTFYWLSLSPSWERSWKWSQNRGKKQPTTQKTKWGYSWCHCLNTFDLDAFKDNFTLRFFFIIWPNKSLLFIYLFDWGGILFKWHAGSINFEARGWGSRGNLLGVQHGMWDGSLTRDGNWTPHWECRILAAGPLGSPENLLFA